MTLRMYADRKKWPLESVAVRLQHAKVYRRDCEECETEDRKNDRIGLELELGGPGAEDLGDPAAVGCGVEVDDTRAL